MKPKAQPRYFYGWNIVGASFLAHIAYAESTSSLLGLYFNPLKREFGWSRTAIAGVQTVERLVEGMVSPLVGPVLDRRGPRVLMVAGGLMATLVFLTLTQVTVLWQFYVLRGAALAVGFALMGSMVSNTAVSNWFIRQRGRAIAASTMGTNLGNMMLVPVLVWIIATHGWQSSWLVFGALTLGLVVLPSALVMRRRPEDMGLLPDGDAPDGPEPVAHEAVAKGQRSPLARAGSSASRQDEGWTRLAVLKTPAFWMLVSSFAVAGLALQGINISLAPYAEDLGLGAGMVATLLVVRAAVTLGFSPLWGLVGEKAGKPFIRALPFLIQAASCVLFLLASQPGFLWAAIIVYSAAMSGTGVIQEVLWADYFGRLTLGTVRSTSIPILVLFSAGGPVFMNLIFDATGSYKAAYLLFTGMFVVAAMMVWVARPPETAARALANLREDETPVKRKSVRP